MNWLTWNVRGIHQKDNITQLKDILRKKDIQFMCLLEPKARHVELQRFAFSTGFSSWLHGGDVNSHIWLSRLRIQWSHYGFRNRRSQYNFHFPLRM